ncbi:FLYWCH-type domain-containing protein [Aphis craccivora]|uniref:FLYWCH-type domain-containing protein n=1 Tax=Aphis craccivora TaxID=307492 RepID=A0A6G0ZMY8_APHCR|nr:FLYWCH-type domain-containing protein [Aphis craccivora]
MYTKLQHDNLVEKNPHNHLPDKEEIKDQVTPSSMINPVEIFTENKQQLKLECPVPTENTVKRMLRRQRSKNCPINSTMIKIN